MLKLCLGPFRSCPHEFHGAAWKWSFPFFLADRWWCRGLGLCGAGEQTLPHPGCGPQWASSCSWHEGGFSKWDDFPRKFVLLNEGLGLPLFGEGDLLLFPVLSVFVSVSGTCAQWVLLPVNPLLFLLFCPWDSWGHLFTWDSIILSKLLSWPFPFLRWVFIHMVDSFWWWWCSYFLTFF